MFTLHCIFNLFDIIYIIYKKYKIKKAKQGQAQALNIEIKHDPYFKGD